MTKQVKPHTIWKMLLMQCIKDVVVAVIEKWHVKKKKKILDKIPCSNDTLGLKIKKMVSDVQVQVTEKQIC